jgi:predicted nucleotidyltransferase
VNELAEKIAAVLAPVPGVLAVVLGGSRASGRGTAASDLDLGLYYAPATPPSLEALAGVATELQEGVPAQLAPPGAWGPWLNGGGWLSIEGTKVDWIFRQTERVTDVFDECISGVVACDYYLGRPHGFHNHHSLGEVQ